MTYHHSDTDLLTCGSLRRSSAVTPQVLNLVSISDFLPTRFPSHYLLSTQPCANSSPTSTPCVLFASWTLEAMPYHWAIHYHVTIYRSAASQLTTVPHHHLQQFSNHSPPLRITTHRSVVSVLIVIPAHWSSVWGLTDIQCSASLDPYVFCILPFCSSSHVNCITSLIRIVPPHLTSWPVWPFTCFDITIFFCDTSLISSFPLIHVLKCQWGWRWSSGI